MPSITDITLVDKASNAQPFAVVLKDGLEAKWSFNNGSSLSLRPFATLRMRPENKSKNLDRKTTIQIVHPYTETVDSVVVTKYASARLELTTPESASTTVIGDLHAYAKAILADALVTSTIEDAQFPY